MKKLVAGLIAGISTLALTLIAVLLSPDTFLQKPWRIISASLGFFALIGLSLQGMLTKRDEDAERIERERLYKLIHQVLRSVQEREQARLSPGRFTHFYIDTAGQAEHLLQVLSHSDATDESAADRALNAIGVSRAGYAPPTNSRETALNLLERLTLSVVGVGEKAATE